MVERPFDDQVLSESFDDNTSIRRVENEEIDSIIEQDLVNHDIKIPFKQEDFTLLYNYQKKVGHKKNQKLGQHFTL